MSNEIEMISGGLKCDSETCDWEDKTIKTEDYPSYINAECPKCGENILTENDYNNVKAVLDLVSVLNTMSKEQIRELSGVEENADSDKKVSLTINTHKVISLGEIKDIDPIAPVDG